MESGVPPFSARSLSGGTPHPGATRTVEPLQVQSLQPLQMQPLQVPPNRLGRRGQGSPFYPIRRGEDRSLRAPRTGFRRLEGGSQTQVSGTIFRLFLGMSRRIRFIPDSGALVEVTCRALQSRFLLRPGPTLDAIILGALARAQRRYAVRIIAFFFASNHFHLILEVDDAASIPALGTREPWDTCVQTSPEPGNAGPSSREFAFETLPKSRQPAPHRPPGTLCACFSPQQGASGWRPAATAHRLSTNRVDHPLGHSFLFPYSSKHLSKRLPSL
jgi:hypothetical protein